jgi:5'-methylthioadenosine phosphorylase
VFRVFAEHTDTLKSALSDVIASVGTDRDCACSHAVDGMDLPFELP